MSGQRPHEMYAKDTRTNAKYEHLPLLRRTLPPTPPLSASTALRSAAPPHVSMTCVPENMRGMFSSSDSTCSGEGTESNTPSPVH